MNDNERAKAISEIMRALKDIDRICDHYEKDDDGMQCVIPSNESKD